jgi:hypothetical protein
MVMAETQISPESVYSPEPNWAETRQDSAACVSLPSNLTCQRARSPTMLRAKPTGWAFETTRLRPGWPGGNHVCERESDARRAAKQQVPRDKGRINTIPSALSTPSSRKPRGDRRQLLKWLLRARIQGVSPRETRMQAAYGHNPSASAWPALRTRARREKDLPWIRPLWAVN